MATIVEPRRKSHQVETTGSVAKPWNPRMWDGMTMRAWFGMLARNGFAVSPTRLPMAGAVSCVSVINSMLALGQRLIYGRRIANTRIEHDPVFILGHWRSGTTLLHELMALDRRHTYPDTYACFTPEHFLFSRYLIPWWLKYLMRPRRPMDNMKVGWERAQEDEFALCNMGVPSPYVMLAFPALPTPHLEYIDLKGVSPRALEDWKQKFTWFLKCLTLRRPKRLVLKSPLHTARVDVLLEMFPHAKFVHIVRDPYVVFPSTMRTWKRLSADEGLQVSKHEGLEEFVLSTFTRMYDALEKSRERVDPSCFCEVRYEDLVADPLGQVRRIYQELDLGDFAQVLPALEKHVAGMKGYRPNQYQLSPETRQQIAQRWGDFIRRYGYW